MDKEHISFEVSDDGPDENLMTYDQTAKIGSLADVNESSDAEGLRVFYYLVQDLKVGRSPSWHGLSSHPVFHLFSHHVTFQDQTK